MNLITRIVSTPDGNKHRDAASATLELLSSTAQVRKGQVHEGLTALFNTSNYALAVLSESNARIVRHDNFPSIKNVTK